MEVPECDDDMATFGNMVLQMGCEDLAALDWPSDGKADSWIDDNTPDTNIFESLAGMPCKNDGDCPNDQLCIDDVCFEGLGTLQATAFWDSHFASEENHGNVLEPLPTGPSSLDARIMLADQATSSIHFVVLYWTADETGLALVDSFCRAVQRGVEVRLIFDSFYQSMSDHVALEQLRDCGVTVLGFNPIGGWLKVADEVRRIERVHEKIFIVDGRVAIMGGRNVNNHYFGQGQWFDYDVILEGPAARSMQAIFLKQWDQFVVWEREANCPQQKKRGYFCPSIDEPVRSTMSRYFPPVQSQSGVSTVRSIYSDPRTQSDSAGHILHAALFRMAKASIQIENAYLIPSRRLREALLEAARRGVRVDIITNSKESNDVASLWYASANFYKMFAQGNVHVREILGTQTIHSKTVLIDGRWGLVGSFNLCGHSIHMTSEIMGLTDDLYTVQSLAQTFQEHLAYSQPAPTEFDALEWTKIKAARLFLPFM